MSAEELQRLADELLSRVGTFSVSGGVGRTFVVSFEPAETLRRFERRRFFTHPSLERAMADAAAWAMQHREVKT
jgi:hypothetical protein